MTITTSTPLYIDGVCMNTYAWNLEAFDGRMSSPGLRGSDLTVSGRHGAMTIPSKTFDAGYLILPMWVRGTDADGNIPSAGWGPTRQTNLDTLRRIFARRSGLLDVRWTRPDTSVRQCFAEVDKQIDFTSVGVPATLRFTVGLTVPGVFWQDTATTSQGFGGMADAATFTVTNLAGATAPMEDGQFTVAGPVSNPKLVDVETGAWVQYGAVLSGGQSVTFDSSSWTASLSTGAALDYSKLTHGGANRLLPLSPASAGPVLQIRHTGGGSSGNVTVTARRKYIAG